MSFDNLNIGWQGLIKLYNILENEKAKICPIAHTYITAHIGVLLNKNGEFLCAQIPEVKGELIPVPCTEESERRTSGIAPHLLHDNLGYVSPYPKYTKRYEMYIAQLGRYIKKNPCDEYANSIYQYVSKGTLLADLGDILNTKFSFSLDKANVIFCVYGLDNEGVDQEWTKYYLSTLPQTGICTITGVCDYIPVAYPACIVSPSGMERLFLEGAGVGYTASQKIIHTIQYLVYASKNENRVEAESHIRNYLEGNTSEENLKGWIEKEYPGKWNQFINLLKFQN